MLFRKSESTKGKNASKCQFLFFDLPEYPFRTFGLHYLRQTGQHKFYARFFTICTNAHRLCVKRDLVPLTYTNTNGCFVLYHFYIASLIKLYPTWWWPQQHWPKHVVDVDRLYTPDNRVVLWMLYLYRIITLISNKHNGDDAPWNRCTTLNTSEL
jgi:hypothetical protein